jgi:uncharacterized protein YggU (UPF0235/DUF167 family)
VSCRLAVKVVPGASRSGLAGWMGETLKVRVTAPPEGGRANRMLGQVVAQALGLPASAVRVVAGAASARKLLQIDGLDARAVRLRLAPEERT